MINEAQTLVRGLGRIESTCIVAGGIIGTTIFLIPSDVASYAGSPLFAMITWICAGLIAGAAAICFAELSASIPATGGTYVFLRRAYRSDFLPFCFAWMMCFAYGSGAIAVVAIMSARYLGPVLLPLGIVADGYEKHIAISMILAIVILNAFGVRRSGIAQTFITFIKLGLLVLLILLPIVLISPLENPLDNSNVSETGVIGVLSRITEGLILCLFAYSGAYFVTHVAEEVKEPEKTIPNAIVVGFLTVFCLYLAFNLVLLAAMPFEELTESKRVAQDVALKALGEPGALIVSAAIFCSAVGVLNAQLLNYPRIPFAAARDGLFFKKCAVIEGTQRVPRNAIFLMGGCACAYVLSGSYSDILGYVAFVSQLFICLAVLSTIILRLREPQLPRPFKVWGYPWTPLIFLLISMVYLGMLLLTKFSSVIVGILVVISGIPFYFYWHRLPPTTCD